MSLLDMFEKVITEHGSSIVQSKTIDLLKLSIVEIEKDRSNLQKENSDLVAKNAELTRQIEAYRASEKYLEVSGAAFKMESEGRYSESAICPVCHIPLSHSIMNDGFRCTRCNLRPTIKRTDISKIIAELNNSIK